MNPTDLNAFYELIKTPELPELGPEPRIGTRTAPELLEDLDRFFEGKQLSAHSQQAFRAAALLWHDHLDESHRISQNLHDSNGSFLHGMMHRREPDFSNAKYWFRHVGPHPAFPELAEKVRRQLTGVTGGEALVARLLSKGQWEPFAFVDACESATRGSQTAEYGLLQQIQALEFQALLPHL